jgi:hypothetical protein
VGQGDPGGQHQAGVRRFVFRAGYSINPAKRMPGDRRRALKWKVQEPNMNTDQLWQQADQRVVGKPINLDMCHYGLRTLLDMSPVPAVCHKARVNKAKRTVSNRASAALGMLPLMSQPKSK